MLKAYSVQPSTAEEPTGFAPPVRKPHLLRSAITAAYRRDEPSCVRDLVSVARNTDEQKVAIAKTARTLITALRGKQRGTGVEGLVHEYALSSQEGVALMCLAEALLRIPDTETRDALIRDKISDGDWKSHLDGSKSLFVNAATWGLAVTGKLTATVSDGSLGAALTRLIARAGEPVIRRGVDMAMRLMGEQFVTGETIAEALDRARVLEAKGFKYSYDMLGEAAATMQDAERYYKDYETAIHAIGKASAKRGVYEGPGISIKLSALHPRYSRAQLHRVMTELLPRVKALAQLAKSYDIGFNIDAEEADRLELSLELLEALSVDPMLGGWNGLGFVVQAYGKRCPFVLDFVIDLAARSNRRIMVRLVKGAYWDAEIKRAQVDGLEDFPVFTRKVHTDVSYIACAKKLLDAKDRVFPQFATHNAQTLATIYHLAGDQFTVGDYEFQCLHGMGEPLYDEVVGVEHLNRPCRIYAPVGTHETLLAYLVRRLLENGANSSFVNRISDVSVSVEQLVADPVDVVMSMPDIGLPHDQIALPSALFGKARINSAGLDLSNENTLAEFSTVLAASAHAFWRVEPRLAQDFKFGAARPVLNPANHGHQIGEVVEVAPAAAVQIVEAAVQAMNTWNSVAPSSRAACLDRAADIMQARIMDLMAIIMREAGKTAANAIGEVREAIDFLRYYAEQARRTLGPSHRGLGPVVCISPWNFPLAIFTGQIAAALVAGNTVIAKPAPATPIIALHSVNILHEAGILRDALQFVPGGAEIGSALIANSGVCGVMFTGSTEVARLIQGQLSTRLSPHNKPVPFIAETGGQNCMIVDSSALPEQVVADVVASAFDSAGQRCSALRVLCLQNDIADRTLEMLKGALHELAIGSTEALRVDIGPVIDSRAQATIETHIDAMRRAGKKVTQFTLSESASRGTFVAPTIIEIDRIDELKREVFGPVLHVLRYKRDSLDALISDINGTGYGLTFGLHTRLDETIAHVTARIAAGNLYVNRNIIGATVGVQPFGGHGLSGTGPKAGGPLYLGRLVQRAPVPPHQTTRRADAALRDFALWLGQKGYNDDAAFARDLASQSAVGHALELDGPVGERNVYTLQPRGRILVLPLTKAGLNRQLAAVLATGNDAVIGVDKTYDYRLNDVPKSVAARLSSTNNWQTEGAYDGALIEGDAARTQTLNAAISKLDGPLVLVQSATTEDIENDPHAYSLNWLLLEVSTSTNTAAAGGNASLMTIG
jgi:RHH-type transcriptional regulator, proline utilization regulon repressor / proline dehydrogenase / delta 1-pyrroline-5-carboxylate dehydrogenase